MSTVAAAASTQVSFTSRRYGYLDVDRPGRQGVGPGGDRAGRLRACRSAEKLLKNGDKDGVGDVVVLSVEDEVLAAGHGGGDRLGRAERPGGAAAAGQGERRDLAAGQPLGGHDAVVTQPGVIRQRGRERL